MATASVNTDAPYLGMELLKAVDIQLQNFGLEVVIFDNGPDALIWKFEPIVYDEEDESNEPPVEYDPDLDDSELVEIIKPLVREMRSEETSVSVGAKAAAVLRMDNDAIRAAITSDEFINSIRSIAASALTQRPDNV